MDNKEMKAPTRKEIMEMVYEKWNPERREELVLLEEACGRIVSQDVLAVNTLPLVRASAMDGIAVRSSDFTGGERPETDGWIYGEDYIRADTGDDFPDAFDAVIPIEEVHMQDGKISLSCDPKEICPGKCVRPSGSMVKEGELILPKGYRITPYRMASLATGGVRQVSVVKKPIIAFIPTGSELIPAGQVPERGQNIESNSLMIRELAKAWGAEVGCMPIVRDQMTELEEALMTAVKQADIVLINGGSSKGSEDYSIPLIRKHGELLQHYAASAPGRPMSVSLVHGKLVINVPGPTLAAFAVADWAVRSAIGWYLQEEEELSREIEAVLEKDVKSPPFMEIYTRVVVSRRDGVCYAMPLGRDSRMEDGAGRCNGIMVTELGKKGYQAGEKAKIKLIV